SSTQLNWGTSYVINDLYKRFLSPRAGERELVRLSRITTVLVMALSLLTTTVLATISGTWAFILEAGAGLGLVLILRWFWWRLNAWSEIAAMVAPLLATAYIKRYTDIQFPQSLFYIVAVTTAAWVVVTLLTPPVEPATLERFYRRVRPGGPGWRPVARRAPEVRPDEGMGGLFVDWIAGVVLVYAMLFAVGRLIFGAYGQAALFLAAGLAAAAVIYRDLSRRGFAKVVE